MTSLAVSSAPPRAASAARSAALPPGPAHISSHFSPGVTAFTRARTRAASCEPSSWTRTTPSLTRAKRVGSPPVFSDIPTGEYFVGSPSTSSLVSTNPGSSTSVTRGLMLSLASSSSSSSPRPSASRLCLRERTIHTGCE